MAQVQEIPEQSHPLPAHQRSHFLVLRHVQGPNKAPPHVGQRYHSTPSGTDEPKETFYGLKCSQCHLSIRAYTDVFLWSVLRLNLINTGQDSIYLGLEYCCISTQGKAEPSYNLPRDTGPGPLLHLGPICIPYEPLDFQRSP